MGVVNFETSSWLDMIKLCANSMYLSVPGNFFLQRTEH